MGAKHATAPAASRTSTKQLKVAKRWAWGGIARCNVWSRTDARIDSALCSTNTKAGPDYVGADSSHTTRVARSTFKRPYPIASSAWSSCQYEP
jgi:hypothetical protein